MKNFVIASLGSLVVAGGASAGVFDGWKAVQSKVTRDGQEYSVLRVYASFTTLDDVLLNVYNSDISWSGALGDIKHDQLFPGAPAWNPQFSAGTGANDSYVTIGGSVGFANTTGADGNWIPPFAGPGIPLLAGWGNTAPPNLQGKAGTVDDGDGGSFSGTLVAQFVRLQKKLTNTITVDGNGNVISEELSGPFDTLNFKGSVTWNQGLGTPGQQFNNAEEVFDFGALINDVIVVIPAPGALALLGLAGVVGGRRRRA
jgi:hypothetical protein